jgi:hypothetical protein
LKLLYGYDAEVIFGASFWTGIHPVALLLAVAAVSFVVLITFILSPAGRPVPPRRRVGGFSRAIADRSDGQGGAP